MGLALPIEIFPNFGLGEVEDEMHMEFPDDMSVPQDIEEIMQDEDMTEEVLDIVIPTAP